MIGSWGEMKNPITLSPHLPISYSYFLMPLHVALNVNRQWQAGNMARHHPDVDSQRRGPASKPLGADAQLIDLS